MHEYFNCNIECSEKLLQFSNIVLERKKCLLSSRGMFYCGLYILRGHRADIDKEIDTSIARGIILGCYLINFVSSF